MSSPFFDWFWMFITRIAEHRVVLPLMLVVFAFWGLKASIRFGFVWGSAGYFSWLIKIVTNRDRPHLVSEEVNVLYPPVSSAFTSGHTALGCAIAIILCVAVWKLKLHKSLKILLCSLAVAVFALGVGFSRIYLGVHYPSDVIGSFITAVPFFFLSVWLFTKIANLKLFAEMKLHPKIKNGFLRKEAARGTVEHTEQVEA